MPSQVGTTREAGDWALTSEQCGVQYLAQGHFDMQLSPAQSWDLNQWPSDQSTCSTRWATATHIVNVLSLFSFLVTQMLLIERPER